MNPRSTCVFRGVPSMCVMMLCTTGVSAVYFVGYPTCTKDESKNLRVFCGLPRKCVMMLCTQDESMKLRVYFVGYPVCV